MEYIVSSKLYPNPNIFHHQINWIILTNIVIETHQSPSKLSFILHQDPDRGADTSVDKFEGEDCTGHRVFFFLQSFLSPELELCQICRLAGETKKYSNSLKCQESRKSDEPAVASIAESKSPNKLAVINYVNSFRSVSISPRRHCHDKYS